MKEIIRLSQENYKQENGIIRKFPTVFIYYDESSKFPYIAKTSYDDYIQGYEDKSKNLKTLIKRLNTYIFCIEYRKGKYLAEKTIGSNIEILDDNFKKEV